MQRDDNPNPFNKLPIELLQVVLSEAGTAEAITNLMHTSKENAAHITQMLRNPLSLLAILSALPAKEMGKVIRTHFSPTSGNYKAIKAAVSSSNNKAAALVCFAFMTDDVSTLNWEALNQAIQLLKKLKEQSETIKENLKKLDGIESHLQMMKMLIQDKKYVPTQSETYLNLSKADLSGADLGRADLRRADLRGANLSGAWLDGANLIGADLSRADLSQAHFSKTDLFGANLSEADLSQADFSGADLRGANLSEADLSQADFSGADLIGANLRGVDLREAKLGKLLSGANLSGTDLRGQSLDWADLRGVNLSGANLRGVGLFYTTLRGANLKGAKLIDATVLSDATQLQAFLTKLNVFVVTDEESKLIVKKAVLHQILDQAKSKEIFQTAHDHPYFSHHRDDTKTEDSDIKKAAKRVSIFFALSPTTSQALLQDKIRELELLESTKPKKK